MPDLIENKDNNMRRNSLDFSFKRYSSQPADKPSEHAALTVERAVHELRRGRVVDLLDDSEHMSVALIESQVEASFERLLGSTSRCQILLSAERAAALGIGAGAGPIELQLRRDIPLGELHELVGAVSVAQPAAQDTYAFTDDPREDDTHLASAALELARQAEAIPALLVMHEKNLTDDSMRLSVQVEDVMAYAGTRGSHLDLVSRSKVQLDAHEDCLFLVFRERYSGREHVAVLVNSAAEMDVPLVRLHSSCLTGDLFGSLRCDCGEQLRDGVARIAADGGGVLLYLNQEGRGIGLANKLRAYALQDAGLDTVDANEHLGFGADQRTYTVACAMLRALDVKRLRLLTNNPIKIAALQSGGIDVIERVASPATPNRFNQRYLSTKREKSGHLSTESSDPLTTAEPGRSH